MSQFMLGKVSWSSATLALTAQSINPADVTIKDVPGLLGASLDITPRPDMHIHLEADAPFGASPSFQAKFTWSI